MKKIKYCILYSIFAICKFIGRLAPRNKNRIIFGAWLGNKYDDNPKALFEYIISNRPDLDVVWLTHNNKIFNELTSNGFPALMTNSIKGIWRCLTSKYLCYCVEPNDIGLYLFTLLNGCVFINLWHGIPLKRVGHDNKFSKKYRKEYLSHFSVDAVKWIEKCDSIKKSILRDRIYHVAPGEEMGKIYEGVFGVKNKYVLKLGQSRNDYFFTPHNNPVIERFKDYKRVVYMPTHRKEGRESIDLNQIFNLDVINEFCKKHNIVFLVKKHFYHRIEPSIPDGRYSNIYELTSYPIKTQELVEAADILVTDYSGVYIDYLLLDRPMIFYAYDLEDYMGTDRDFYLPYDEKHIPGRICLSSTELLHELEILTSGEDPSAAIRQRMKNYYYSPIAQKAVSEIQISTFLTLE